MTPRYDFTGQVALVTGAGSGMGLATARAFAEAGAAVVLADINGGALRAATDDLTDAGHQALGVTCDVSSEEQVAATVDRAVAAYGRLDVAFNNAGIQAPPTDAADETAATFDRVNAINEDHWHGAAPTRFMTHLALQQVDDRGSAATWGPLVTDDEYGAAPEAWASHHGPAASTMNNYGRYA